MILSQGTFDNGGLNHGLITSNMSAMVDLQNNENGQFSEPFYILLMEKMADGAKMHMWRIVLSSTPDGEGQQNDYDSSGSVTPDAEHPGDHHQGHHQMSEVHVSTEKVSSMMLPLPEGVEVVHAVPAVGHLSSSSIYPACLAPYVIVTACSGKSLIAIFRHLKHNSVHINEIKYFIRFEGPIF